MKAWHFTGDRLSDGQPVPCVGEKLIFAEEPILRGQGYSRRIIDALQYASGNAIHRVELGGSLATERTVLFTVDGTDLLRKFARQCALDVIHLWAAPDVVKEYLKTGSEQLRSDANAAANDTWHATATAWATWAARDEGATASAIPAAAAAAWAAIDARYARHAAVVAARTAADAAAVDAPGDVTAAWNAARAKQNRRLTSMVMAAQRSK